MTIVNFAGRSFTHINKPIAFRKVTQQLTASIGFAGNATRIFVNAFNLRPRISLERLENLGLFFWPYFFFGPIVGDKGQQCTRLRHQTLRTSPQGPTPPPAYAQTGMAKPGMDQGTHESCHFLGNPPTHPPARA